MTTPISDAFNIFWEPNISTKKYSTKSKFCKVVYNIVDCDLSHFHAKTLNLLRVITSYSNIENLPWSTESSLLIFSEIMVRSTQKWFISQL